MAGHDVLTVENVVLHALPAAFTVGAVYATVKAALRDQRILKNRQGWSVRKIIQLVSFHNSHHPEDRITTDDFPRDGNGGDNA